MIGSGTKSIRLVQRDEWSVACSSISSGASFDASSSQRALQTLSKPCHWPHSWYLTSQHHNSLSLSLSLSLFLFLPVFLCLHNNIIIINKQQSESVI